MRKAEKVRKTTETKIKVKLNIDGAGKSKIVTGIDFLDHMLTLFSFHGLFDLTIEAKGDLKIDSHHTNEDLGIVLGQAFKEALGNKKGIKRYGFSYVPMGEALSRVVVDISGRGELYFTTLLGELPKIRELGLNLKDSSIQETMIDFQEKSGETYHLVDLKSFLESFAKHSGISINVGLLQKEDTHHQAEAVFKALGIALDQATRIDLRRKGVPSTKGVID
ncbi:MAG: imidazoleglycerol-phosphate dehydratase [Candidatus Omnitrophota bacterium]